MPRQATLDSSRTLHHVMVRGIERRQIVDLTSNRMIAKNEGPPNAALRLNLTQLRSEPNQIQRGNDPIVFYVGSG